MQFADIYVVGADYDAQYLRSLLQYAIYSIGCCSVFCLILKAVLACGFLSPGRGALAIVRRLVHFG